MWALTINQYWYTVRGESKKSHGYCSSHLPVSLRSHTQSSHRGNSSVLTSAVVVLYQQLTHITVLQKGRLRKLYHETRTVLRRLLLCRYTYVCTIHACAYVIAPSVYSMYGVYSMPVCTGWFFSVQWVHTCTTTLDGTYGAHLINSWSLDFQDAKQIPLIQDASLRTGYRTHQGFWWIITALP